MYSGTKKLLIVAPYRDEDAFLEKMAQKLGAKIEFLNYKTNLSVSRSTWRRHLVILAMAYKATQVSKDKDYIIFGEQFVGLYYAFFKKIFFWQSSNSRSMVLQLIYNRKNGFLGSVYKKIYKWLISSPDLNFLICHASLEREYYNNEFEKKVGGKIFFVPFGRSEPSEIPAIEAPAHNRYFFSGGTSNRDYKTLINAFRGISENLTIACHANDIKGIELPHNVTALHNVFGADFQKYIDGSYAVILPILHTDVSAGQLVLIDAMRSGKASIVTTGSCMDDYIDTTSAIGVPKQDVNALRAAVVSLGGNAEFCKSLGASAKNQYQQSFTRRAFAERLCDVMHAQN